MRRKIPPSTDNNNKSKEREDNNNATTKAKSSNAHQRTDGHHAWLHKSGCRRRDDALKFSMLLARAATETRSLSL